MNEKSHQLVNINGLEIGCGKPKVIVPVTGKTSNDILKEVQEMRHLRFDIIEWRIDFFDHVTDSCQVIACASSIKQFCNKPLLITFRTKAEGGQRALSKAAYFQLYNDLIASRIMELIDIELFMPENDVQDIIKKAHLQGIKVILCNHEFSCTPRKDEIIHRLIKMQELGADICKIAVMPQSPQDVLTLLCATEEMNRRHATRPIITMSMGKLGLISRLNGELVGSSCTFGIAKTASAPGQISVEELQEALTLLSLEGSTE